MRRALVLALLLPMTGCLAPDPAGPQATFEELLPAATAKALETYSDAVLVSAYAVEEHGTDPAPGDGRAGSWSYLFAIRDRRDIACVSADAGTNATRIYPPLEYPRSPDVGMPHPRAVWTEDSPAVVARARENASFAAEVERLRGESYVVGLDLGRVDGSAVGPEGGDTWIVSVVRLEGDGPVRSADGLLLRLNATHGRPVGVEHLGAHETPGPGTCPAGSRPD